MLLAIFSPPHINQTSAFRSYLSAILQAFQLTHCSYKPLGGTKIEDGRPDRCEIYSLPMDDLLAPVPLNRNPPAFESQRPLLISCAKHMHSIASLILTQLSMHLSLPPQTLSSMHAFTERSPSNLRFLHMPPQQASAAQTSLMGHTDNGSVTVLFNIIGGLQILDEKSGWRYVRPEPGHAIVNLGDSVVQVRSFHSYTTYTV